MFCKIVFLFCPVFLSLFPLEVIANDNFIYCYKEIENDFFQKQIVGKAFSLHNVDQSQWTPLYDTLQRNARSVPEIIRRKARSLEKNPFEQPLDNVAAAKILNEALYEVFDATMKQMNFLNQTDIERMFQYIKEKQSLRLKTCLGLEENEY